MRTCKAFVTTVKNDGLAEIVFQSDHPGIPGASDEINQKVCHCTPGPITIDAENGAGARPGDMVMVAWDKTARRKKTVILFGMPAIGLFIGLLCAAGFAFIFFPLMALWVVFPMTGLFAGLFFSVDFIKKLQGDSLPRIVRVIRSREDMASMPRVQHCPVGNVDDRCSSCFGSRC